MKWIDYLMLFGGIIFILSSCSKSTEYQSDQNTFDLEGLVNSQVFFLYDNHYGIHKITKLGSKEEVVEQYPDSSGWANELKILKTADINKPGVRPYYNFKSSESFLYSIDSYILNETGRSNTLFQKIYRDKQTNHLARIMVEQRIDNPIYHSGRYIVIVFKGLEEDVVIIDSIKVTGYQKIIFLDTTFYNSISRIIQ